MDSDGQEHGKWTQWSRDGKVLGTNEWDHGSGSITNWHDNGQKQSEGEYKAGDPVGRHVAWHDNGQKKSEGEWNKEGKHGKWSCWDKAGKEAPCPD